MWAGVCYGSGMAQTVCLLVSAEDRARLAAILADRNRPQKHVARARVILHSAERRGVAEVARRAGISRPAVWRWQQRFAEAGVDGLLRDKTRKPGKPPIPAESVARVVALTCGAPPGEATHWTGRAMAKAAGISLRSVQRIWEAHRLQPHRVRSFKRSRDPKFAEKLVDIVGLSLAPPAQAVVLSIDEREPASATGPSEQANQIQALDRTQPGLPLKPGRCGTMTHDSIRHGTTTLFAALDVLTGRVFGRCMQRHRHAEFIRFLNAVETFFSKLTRQRIRRGSFHCLVDLQVAIKRYLAEHNTEPKPFVWTAPAVAIMAKLGSLDPATV